MNIAVLGTGIVGRTLGAAFADRGHVVTIGTRDPAATLARDEPDPWGGPPFAAWLDDHPDISLATFAGAAEQGELVVNATTGHISVDVLRLAGEEQLSGKVIVDVSNAMDFSEGFPPKVLVENTDSVGEMIQRAFPSARVVKTLNTVDHSVMVDPKGLAGGDHSVFVSGEDADAKAVVTGLLRELGWTDVVDLGGIRTARGAEMMVLLWIDLYQAFGTAALNVKVVR